MFLLFELVCTIVTVITILILYLYDVLKKKKDQSLQAVLIQESPLLGPDQYSYTEVQPPHAEEEVRS